MKAAVNKSQRALVQKAIFLANETDNKDADTSADHFHKNFFFEERSVLKILMWSTTE